MKKHLMSLLALALGIGMAQAGPVSVSQAKYVGQQFVQANFEETRQSAELTLVYTGTAARGEASYYIFNVGNDGFVIVSADDNFRPLIAYSEEGNYDLSNPVSNAYLNSIAESRSSVSSNVIDPLVKIEWENLMNSGRLISRNGGRGVDYLVQTKWNQNVPYNSICPYDAQSTYSGYHAYVGSVATAMSQIMKYWNYPTQGQGSHSYYHNKYGTLSANFGATTYDWDNMLNSYSSGNYTTIQSNAVATLCYHCGVAVDTDYGGDVEDGSSSNLSRIPDAISTYFRYSPQAYVVQKPENLTSWQNLLKESFDMGWPIAYSGTELGAGYDHTFICDGYNDNDLFHFNWGWGGTGDGMFLIEGIDYTQDAKAVFNFVPADVYDNTAQAPTNFTVTPAPNYELSATLTWKNPTKNLSNANLTSIDRVVVTRNGEVIYTENNVTPGANMSITDSTVPRFDAFNYCVYVVVNGAHGKNAYKNQVSFGPTCEWTVNITQAAMNGFRGGAIHIYNSAGTEFTSVTTTSSNVQSISVDMSLGHVAFGWSPQTTGADFNMGFSIKNSQNQTVYTYSGTASNMPVGIFFEDNNTCGNEAPLGIVTNCVALRDEESANTIYVSWNPLNGANGYGYTVYRDNRLLRLVPYGTSFVDENVSQGGHCYYVGYLGYGGENGLYSNESCATAGACYAPTNLDYEYTSTYKIKLKWERPVPSDGLSGYYLFRKTGEYGEYTRIKLLGASATNYTDNSANQDGTYYYYKLYAYYQALDCTSAPASWIYDHNQFYIRVLYSSDVEYYNVNISPNPTNGGNVGGGGSFTEGQSCTVTATPNTNYTFNNWTENGTVVSTNASYTFNVTGNRDLVANFTYVPPTYTVSVSASPANGGNVGGGGTFTEGQSCTLTATPNANYTFTNWTENGTVVSSNTNYTFTVTGNRNLVANFTADPVPTYTITVSANPANGGSATGGGTYNQGSSRTVTATANSGYRFTNWTENGNVVSSNASYTFTVTANRNLVANFTADPVPTYTITVSANPTNGGSVSGGGTFEQGESCTVTATANNNYTFAKWTENGSLASTNATYTFPVNNNRNLVANFNPIAHEYTVTADPDPAASGTIMGAGTYEEGAICELTAIPNEGYIFENWTRNGNVISDENPYSFSVNRDLAFVAHFSQDASHFTIIAKAEPIEGGSVSGGGTFESGETCHLNAVAAEGYEFVNWTLNGIEVSSDPSCNFPVTGNATYVAHFRRAVNHYTITVSIEPTDAGSVLGAETYEEGTTCTLIAMSNPTYSFVGWMENGVVVYTESPYSFRVDRNRTLVAVFSQGLFYTISASAGPNGTISPSGDVRVMPGEDQTFAFIPDNGCSVSRVIVDGIDRGAEPSHTFRNVNEDHTIYVQFSGLGVDDHIAPNLKLYPNPAQDKINIESPNMKHIAVFNLLGVQIESKDVNDDYAMISTNEFPQGTYILKVEYLDGSVGYSRFVVAK